MDNCSSCEWSIEINAQAQALGDLMIALAYFSIPLELLYFVVCSRSLPFQGVVLQFVLFIVLCGITHLLSVLQHQHHHNHQHQQLLLLCQTIAKILTALVSCYTVSTLMRIIPHLLRIKLREKMLQEKTQELDKRMDRLRKKQQAGRNVRLLTTGIRSTIDSHTILNMSLFELARTLGLNNCTIWMPNSATEADCMILTHELERRPVQEPLTVPISDPVVQLILNAGGAAVEIPSDCCLGRASSHQVTLSGKLAAVRLPVVMDVSTKAADAIMVLLLPIHWSEDELELVELVADQVAVALSHAAVLEESMRIQAQLAQQNKLLENARLQATKAIKAKREFLRVTESEMRSSMHVISALSSLLWYEGGEENEQLYLEQAQQKALAYGITRNSSLVSSMLNDMFHFGRQEHQQENDEEQGTRLHSRKVGAFQLPSLLQQAIHLSSTRVSLDISQDVPSQVVGDDLRLMQLLLNAISSADSSAGWEPNRNVSSVNVQVTVYSPVQQQDEGGINDFLDEAGGTYLKFQVRSSNRRRNDSVSDSLRITVCKRIAQVMQGKFWMSRGYDGCLTTSFIICVSCQQDQQQQHPFLSPTLSAAEGLSSTEGLRVLIVDDKSMSRFATSKLLSALGCKVTVTESGMKCLGTFSSSSQSFEVVVLELSMMHQDMDGYELGMQIRKVFNSSESSVRPVLVALTAQTDDKETRQRCFKAGIDEFLSKPVSLEELRRILMRLVTQLRIRGEKQHWLEPR